VPHVPIRITRFYRAYPEFDRLSELECRALAIRARVERGDAAWFIPLAAGLLLALVSAAFGYMIALLVLTAAGAGGGKGRAPVAGSTAAANMRPLELALLGGVALLGLAVFGAVFVIVRRQLILRTMRRLIARALCPFCEFSLVGLMPSQGRVRCPECGEVVVLAEHRIHEDDLIPDTPEGRKAMQARWRQFGADRYGSLSGGKPEQAGPKGPQREKWMDPKRPR